VARNAFGTVAGVAIQSGLLSNEDRSK